MFVVEMKEIQKKYGSTNVLDNLNYSVQKGTLSALLGPNGAGKTTIIRLLSGLSYPSNGIIKLFGKESEEALRVARGKIGTLIEYPTFYKSLSAYDNLMINSLLKGVNSKQRCLQLLDYVKLENTSKKVKNYSLGMKQRLGLAKALMSDPELLILDEPTNGLDPNGIVEFRNMILDLKSKGKTIIVCSHILSEMEHVADDYSFLKNGNIVKTITSKELKNMNSNIEVEVNDLKKSIEILTKRFNIEDIVTTSNNSLTIKNNDLEVSDVIGILTASEYKIEIKNITKSSMSLENYFQQIVS